MDNRQQNYPNNYIEPVPNGRYANIERKQKVKKTLMQKFLIAFGVSFGIFFLVAAGLVIAYNSMMGRPAFDMAIAKDIDSNIKSGGSLFSIFEDADEHTNFVIFGVDDDGTRTDTIIVGSFNSKSKEINLLSIPRDTYVVMPENRRAVLKEMGLWTPSDGAMKLNEVHHYAGKENGVLFVMKQLEEMLNIEIPYYVKVNLDAFKFIVDELDGVEFDVPIKMDYEDKYQNLFIHLKPGIQILDGEQAMQLVRFRGYPGGDDWKRSQVQQDFIKAIITQVVSDGNLLNNAPTMLKAVYDYVETNMDISDALKYLKYAGDIKAENINTYNLREGATTPKINGKDFVKLDYDYVSEVVDEVFYNFSGDEIEIVPSVGKSIQVLNGGMKSGIASKNKEYLEDNGFVVDNIGDYSGTKSDYTRIYVKKKGWGADIKDLYPESKLIVDSKVTSGYDIVIILGTNEE